MIALFVRLLSRSTQIRFITHILLDQAFKNENDVECNMTLVRRGTEKRHIGWYIRKEDDMSEPKGWNKLVEAVEKDTDGKTDYDAVVEEAQKE